MAINQQTLNAAKNYTDEQVGAHAIAADPHPQYAQLTDAAGNPTGGRLIHLVVGEAQPPVEAGSIMFDPNVRGTNPPGVWIPNEAVTAWVLLGSGQLPADTTAPTVPGNFRVTAKTTTSITVAWNASTDAETGVSGYDVMIGAGAWVPAGNVLTYTFGSLTAGTSYVMRVRARDNANTPNVSAGTSLTDSTSAAPITVPQNVRISAVTTNSITLAWAAPPSGTVLRYETRLGAGAFTSNGTALTKPFTSLIEDTPYTAGVRAVFTDGTTSAEVTASGRTSTSTPVTQNMYIGLHVIVPSATDVTNNPELAQYRNTGTKLGVLQLFESQMNTLSGFSDNPLMSMGHSFYQPGDNYVLDSWATQQMSRMASMSLNFKPNGGANTTGMQQTASGADDARIIALINSLPTGKRIYMTYFHEPDETGGAFADAWRAANARWAKLILDNRGSKDLHPMVCQTTFSFRPANATIQNQFLSVTDDYEALGIDWRNQVVMAPDGYENAASVAGNPPDAADTYKDVFPVLKARGWKRFGITETAASTKVGNAGSTPITALDVQLAPVWARSLVRYAQANNFEYICWFNTTGSRGPVGHWQYTDAMKKVWGEAAHFRGVCPTWPTP